MNTAVVRPAQSPDAPIIAAIYNEGIRGRAATFETDERRPEDILAWFSEPTRPFLVAEVEGEVLGFIVASAYRPRACYTGVAEFSVYVKGTARGRGVGGTLMASFLPACERAGLWKLVSRIFPDNRTSRRLCARFGFREVGVYEKHARLDGLWHDVVIVERLLEGNL